MNIWFALIGMSSFFASLVVSYLDYRLRVKAMQSADERMAAQTQFELQQMLFSQMTPEIRDKMLTEMALRAVNLPDDDTDKNN